MAYGLGDDIDWYQENISLLEWFIRRQGLKVPDLDVLRAEKKIELSKRAAKSRKRREIARRREARRPIFSGGVRIVPRPPKG